MKARRARSIGRPAQAACAVVVTVAVVIGLAGGGAAPAWAHGGGGAITLVQAEQTGPTTYAVEVCVTFTLDRDQADTARVTMRADGPGETSVPEQHMEVGAEPGLRQGEIELPTDGSWTITVESTFPPAQLAIPVTMGGAGDRPTPAATAITNLLAASCEPDSNDLPTWLVAGLGTAAAVIVFGGLLLLLRRSATPPADATT